MSERITPFDPGLARDVRASILGIADGFMTRADRIYTGGEIARQLVVMARKQIAKLEEKE